MSEIVESGFHMPDFLSPRSAMLAALAGSVR